jgi:hypothetical protein
MDRVQSLKVKPTYMIYSYRSVVCYFRLSAKLQCVVDAKELLFDVKNCDRKERSNGKSNIISSYILCLYQA